MNPVQQFSDECRERVEAFREEDCELRRLSQRWLLEAYRSKYMYNFTALGRPMIQLPQDIVAIQELLWSVKPDLVIETGIAHGGSLIMHAACLAANGGGHVLGIDIDIRAHNRAEIERHAMAPHISMFEGSSTDPQMIDRVCEFAGAYERVLVILDSNHTHDHVLAELRAYAPLVAEDSYCIVLDTIVEDLPSDTFPDRPWGPGNSPRSAIDEFLLDAPDFVADRAVDAKLLITCAPGGFLRRTSTAGGRP